MGETRDPAAGMWVVFEGDKPATNKEQAEAFRGGVNAPIEWPVTLRVFHVRDGVMRSVDVEVDEQLQATVQPIGESSLRD